MEPQAPARLDEIKRFRFAGKGSEVAADVREKYGYDGDLLQIYAGNAGPVVHKWHHYLPIYDRYFAPVRATPVKFLEIGVSKGGSLQMWRSYFGPDAVIFGIDIDPACAAFDGQSGQVRIGSQDDPDFLASVVAEMGGVDVVLDDGSHHMDHIRASLKILFPLLSMGGTYMIEDLHTAYWRRFGGGHGRASNFFNEVRQMIDDMHHWYHGRPPHDADRAAAVSGMHIHDSIVVLDKRQVHTPTHSKIGR
jgi:23S rRNA U2552 (ribose-2'-O)-methylase RlmE/FtsJ